MNVAYIKTKFQAEKYEILKLLKKLILILLFIEYCLRLKNKSLILALYLW